MSKKHAPKTTPPPSDDPRWLTCDGLQLSKMARAGLEALESNRQAVNDLNVFPIPDGDTGTNMVLTMREAVKRIQDFNGKHVGEAAHELSDGALMGSRGNSGVILSQIWRGLARGLKDKERFTADDLAHALQESSDTAYKGVITPVEGTILTVIREGAEEAADAVTKSNDLRFILARVIERCQQSLDRTPDLLPVLKEAGVVDAGGQGLVHILEGMLGYVHGDIELSVGDREVPHLSPQALAAPAEGLEYPFDVQYILFGNDLDLHSIRDAIDEMGDSTVVVGDENTIKVHVHVKDPGVPLSYGVKVGEIADIVVENMQVQMDTIIGASTASPMTAVESFATEVNIEPGQIGVVAVAAGDGIAEIFKSLGANGIVNGGQSNNPSTEEIYKVVQEMPTDRVIILPNNRNIFLAAKAARDLSTKEVRVVPTRNVPHAVSALLSIDRDGDLDKTARAMEEACDHVSSGEIAIATRSAELHGVTVAEGEVIGVANGRLCASSSEIYEVLKCVLDEMDMDERELVTIYYGNEVSEAEADQMAEEISNLYPELEVEILSGGQSIYQYILGAE
ncbi:MAG TPA: DAK2 domain-containing protein [candidate division Zixibacteria bacterium]|nr:DAK2 domain-containing protein [candidate division Zixibacteria bacterium]